MQSRNYICTLIKDEIIHVCVIDTEHIFSKYWIYSNEITPKYDINIQSKRTKRLTKKVNINNWYGVVG